MKYNFDGFYQFSYNIGILYVYYSSVYCMCIVCAETINIFILIWFW